MLEANAPLDAPLVRRWCMLTVTLLRRHEQELNELNVYPVPDGDTGTNLLLTFTAAERALREETDSAPDAGAAMRIMARGALLGARGNSGVIAAQWLAGLADVIAEAGLPDALEVAADAAYQAVAHPVEGTILSVARAVGGSDVRAAVTAAEVALARTPEQLPVLKSAGVVDAGGRGLVIILHALAETVTGEPSDLELMTDPRPVLQTVPAAGTVPVYHGPAYEVQFMIDADEVAITKLRGRLDRLGDSLVVIGDRVKGWRVHVHVDDAGAALEAGLDAGRPYQIMVTHLTGPTADHAPRRPDPAARAVVVTSPGAGVSALLAQEGAVCLPQNPSTAEVLEAILETGAGRVAVLPTDVNLTAVAQAAADEAFGEGVKVRVIPTRSPVQALAALAVRDSGRRFEDDVIAMAEAAVACRPAEVTTASREALTVAGRCQPGDVLALVEGEVNVIGQDLIEVCCEVLDRMLATGRNELVTLLTGADAPDELAAAVTAYLQAHWPLVEVHAYPGGQPHYPLLIGVE